MTMQEIQRQQEMERRRIPEYDNFDMEAARRNVLDLCAKLEAGEEIPVE